MKAELLAIGSELLGPLRSETNSLWLTQRLLDAGIEVVARATLADDPALLESALRAALSRADVVIATAALGPTVFYFPAHPRDRTLFAFLCGNKKIKLPPHMPRDISPTLFKTLHWLEGCTQQLTHLFLCFPQIVPGFCKIFFGDHAINIKAQTGSFNVLFIRF